MTKRISTSLALLLSLLFITGCYQSKPLRGNRFGGSNYTLRTTDSETGPPMQFDPSKPFHMELGRGSGLDGFDTVVLEENGQVVLHLLKDPDHNTHWETTSLSLDTETVGRIANLIQELQLVKMERAYYAGVYDGTQWIFLLRQGDREKSIYFDNHFPEEIQEFAVAIDEELQNGGSGQAEWTVVPEDEFGRHDDALRESIQSDSTE